jgi:hypothetical protein
MDHGSRAEDLYTIDVCESSPISATSDLPYGGKQARVSAPANVMLRPHPGRLWRFDT